MTNKERLCSTCIYGDKIEYDKPCVIYSDNCQLYEEKKHMTVEEREKEIRKQPTPTKEECLSFYKELVKLADVRFVPYYKMAIEVLAQQPCEDCINKEEVDTLVDELARAISDERCYMSRGRSTATIMQDLLNLPSVTPSRPKGKWIDDNCSICGYGVEEWNNTPYCPSCGAKMGGGENDNR